MVTACILINLGHINVHKLVRKSGFYYYWDSTTDNFNEFDKSFGLFCARQTGLTAGGKIEFRLTQNNAQQRI